ncbi:MAG: alpha-2-macroglobulin family protein [Muribaculaceae bacterium]|nr:alpha-2-macroglobulin family protein [Muribaculaceae bacterium]
MKKAIYSLIILLIISTLTFTTTSMNTYKPDFAYPDDVIAHADSIMLNIKHADNSNELIPALVQYSIAKSNKSNDYIADIINKIEEFVVREKNINTKNILLSFEAIVYNDYYNHNYYTFSNRTESTESLPADINEWSNEQITNKIKELISRSLENKEITATSSITEYKNSLSFNEYGEMFYPTVYDFLANNAIDILNDYRWKNNTTKLINNITAQLLELNKDNIPVIISIKTKQDYNNTFENYVKLYNQYSDNQYSGLILEKISAGKEHQQAFYTLLTQFKARFPYYPFMQKIQAMINNLCNIEASLENTGVFSSHDSITFDVNTTNITNAIIRLYHLPDNNKNQPYDIQKMDFIDSIHITVPKGDIPFNNTTQIKFKPQKYGIYTATIAYNKTGKEIESKPSSTIIITDLSTTIVEGVPGTKRIIVSDGKSGKPIKGVEISLIDTDDKIIQRCKTGKDGTLDINNNRTNCINIQKGKDKYNDKINLNYFDSNKKPSKGITIFTDLAVYRPGETVNFVGIAHCEKAIEGLQLTAYLIDSNFNRIDSIALQSDEYGRIASSFVIPKTGLKGEYSIEIEDSKDEWEGSKDFEVAPYKLPTFSVEIIDEQSSYQENAPIIIKGKAITFSQVPLVDNKVTITLSQDIWDFWRFFSPRDAEVLATFECTTNDEGLFELEIPKDSIGNTDDFYSYGIEAMVTSVAGETQSASTSFIIGNYSKLSLNEMNFEVSNPIILPIKYESTNEEKKECKLQLINEANDTVFTGAFTPGVTALDFSTLKSGKYTLMANIIGTEKQNKLIETIVLYRNSDSESPISSPLWIPINRIEASNDKAIIILASDTQSYIYYTAYTDDKIINSGWIKFEAGMNKFIYNIADDISQPITLNLFTVKDYKITSKSIIIIPRIKPDKLGVVIESFRDKVTAGDVENWKFRFTNQNNLPLQAATILNIYNIAVDKITQNVFDFTIMPIRQISLWYSYDSFYSFRANTYNQIFDNKYAANTIEIPQFNMYGNSMFGNLFHKRMYGINASLGMFDKEANVIEECAFAESSEAVDNNKDTNFDNVEARIGELNVALWKPFLKTDNAGNIEISFNVPNYNTTWGLRTISYTKNLLTHNLAHDFVASKPIMVQPNLPRFLRQGDSSIINAVVINASDTIQNCDAIIELFNPENNEIYLSQSYSLNIGVNKQESCQISWNIPDTIAILGYRIKATNGRYGDGEQNIIPVLPSISPVIESKPFYLNETTNKISFIVPKIPANATATLDYYDDPAWLCVTALPSIFDSSASTSTNLAHSLYSIFVAKWIAHKDSRIKDAIEYWNNTPKDSALISMLEKNSSLKISELQNSPWLNDAQRQTLQMQSIAKLYDDSYIESCKNEIIERLAKLQQHDGGWSWYENGKSSYYTTATVLELIGDVYNTGLIKTESRLNKMIVDAVKYLDTEVINRYNKQKIKNDFSQFAHYAYIRAFYDNIPRSEALNSFSEKGIQYFENNWKKMEIADRAFAAILLAKYNKNDVAKNIVKSLKQNAISTSNNGMYWDNLQIGSYAFYRKVSLTSLLLRAIATVDSNDSAIDKIREWILLQKQTTDWGDSSMACEAINSLLTTGSNWLEKSANTIISIDNEQIANSSLAKFTGHYTSTIKERSGKTIRINREGKSPAWGALIWQYQAPMAQIKAASINGLSITKELYDKKGKLLLSTEKFKVGDRVRVMLTIKTAQDLEYVTINDERCASFEPIDQISGYRFCDTLGFYSEVNNDNTNMFISFLPKGTYKLYYDVTISANGSYNLGIATIQSQYSPQFTAHSAGKKLTIK